MSEKIEFLSAVLIVSKDPKRLADFYKDIVGLPLEDEEHGKTDKHYGCELGDLHFAIHPLSNFEGSGTGVGAVKLAFTVFNMEAFVQKVKSKGLEVLYPPKDTGFSIMTALKDPDGNYIEFTQLSDRWFQHLQKRKQKGIDVVARWEATK